ncbi:MAG: formimidoylglutamate deiminase [Caulobacter sp.]|nr:formimidoylglutamate deiminase [Caulobacter sp.]
MDLFLDQARLPEGWARNVRIAVADGVIAAITPDADPAGSARSVGAAIPAMTNLHSHAFQRAMAGLAEQSRAGVDDFWAWRGAMYGFLQRLTPDDVEAIAAMLQVELMEQGYGGIVEFHYLHNDIDGRPYADRAAMAHAIRRAAAVSGITLTLAPVLYTSSSFGGAPPLDGQKRFLMDPDAFLDLLGETNAEALAFHSLRAVTPRQIEYVLERVSPDIPVHIHVAEQTGEVDDCLTWSGERPVEWLLGRNLLTPRWTLVHATHMTDAEAGRVARAGATVALCPSTEGNLGDGVFNAAAFLRAGGTFGIGSDSHVSTSPVEELRWFEYGRRLQARKRALGAGGGEHVGAWLWLAAAASGARPTGRATGVLEVGAAADIVVLDTDHPALAGREDDLTLDSFVFSGQGCVREVWTGGVRRVENGRHQARDGVAAAYRKTIERLKA